MKRFCFFCGAVLIMGSFILFCQSAWARTLTIASINALDPADEVRKFMPLADYMQDKLKGEGIDRIKVAVTRSIEETAALIRDGRADLFIDSPYPSAAVSWFCGSKFLLRRWKKGIGEYEAYIFTRNNSGIDDLEDLKGRIIAFEEPRSSSGYFFPKTAFKEKGIPLVQKSDPNDPVSSQELGYIFSHDDETTMVLVLKKRVAAGAMDHQNYEKHGKGKLEDLRVLHKIPFLPRHIVSHRADLSSGLVSRIKTVLLEADQTERGRNVLDSFEKTTRFDELTQENLAVLSAVFKLIGREMQASSR